MGIWLSILAVIVPKLVKLGDEMLDQEAKERAEGAALLSGDLEVGAAVLMRDIQALHTDWSIDEVRTTAQESFRIYARNAHRVLTEEELERLVPSTLSMKAARLLRIRVV